jgi:hypothetical protein
LKELEDLQTAMLREAEKASTIDDMSKIAGGLKTIAEARSALSTELTGRRAYLLELIKSLSAFFVPLVSLLALGATVIVQTKQIEATQQQVENSEWRDLLSSLKGPSDSVYTDVTVAPRLKSFASSSTYGEQARQISIRLMGRLSNPDGFEDLFSYVFPVVNNNNISLILDVSRTLNKSKSTVEGKCGPIVANSNEKDEGYILTYCAEGLDDKEFLALMLNSEVARRVAPFRQSLHDLGRESIYLSQALTPFLRTEYEIGNSQTAKPINLSNVYISNVNLSNLDLSTWDMTNTIFDQVNLAGANLTMSKFDGVDLRGCNWWDAQAVAPSLLPSLIDRYRPYYVKGSYYPVELDEEKYKQSVRNLCARMRVACPDDIGFGQFRPAKPS